jgi:hypothetical protein
MTTDNLYKELVAGALEDNQLTARINFRLGEYAVHSSDYAVVARAIRGRGPEGAVSVSRSAGGKGQSGTRASYRPKQNALWFNEGIWESPSPFKPLGNWLKERSTWVHEATHCIQDLKDWKLTVGRAEMMAHIAQAFPLVRTNKALLFNEKLAAAGVIAEKLLEPERLGPVQADDLAALATALKKVKRYKERWDKIFDFSIDGDDGT